jgi:hypothetical protein
MSGSGSDGKMNENAKASAEKGVRYDPARMAQQFGQGLAHEGVSLGEFDDAHIPDVDSGKSTGGFAAAAGIGFGQGSGFQGSYNTKSKAPAVRRGKAISDVDPAMYPFNVVAGSRSANTFVVGRDDRMSVREARRKLEDILEAFGLLNESHEFCYSFTQALFVAHALNGASIVGPGRARFTVAGSEYSYGDVIRILGSDSRRFFRAYADDIARALSKLLQDFDPADHESIRVCGQIRSIAVARQLVQFPYLIHDSADACVKLSTAEMAAVVRSKEFVLKDAPNSIDALTASSSK